MWSTNECMRFAGAWDGLMDAVNARHSPRANAFVQLVAAYGEPHRHYHNLQHIIDMHDRMPWLNIAGDPDRILVQLATWYHDVVYDPRSAENEFRSADVARIALTELGLSSDPIERVCQLILMTKNHQAPPNDQNALLFLDGDLSILGMNPETYGEYAKAIRLEYAHVADQDYKPGRKKVLTQFLERPLIFHSIYFRTPSAVWESQARANIAAEIARLGE